MSDVLGTITVPSVAPSGTFPLKPAFGFTTTLAPKTITHTFGAANLKREQTFYDGPGTRQWVIEQDDFSLADLAALKSFYEGQGGSLTPFTFHLPLEDGTTTDVYATFANEPQVWDYQVGNAVRMRITLNEFITGSGPSYTSARTCLRFPDSTFASALSAQVQTCIKLVIITPKLSTYPVMYMANQRVTIDGQLYQPRVLKWEGIQQVGIGLPGVSAQSDDVTIVLGNADRVMRQVADSVMLDQADVQCLIYHVNSNTLLQLWRGIITPGGWASNVGPEFTVHCSDVLSSQFLVCPPRQLDRVCSKLYNDGNECPYGSVGHLNTTDYPSADASFCDRGYTTANGCQAHSMKLYYNGVVAQPQPVTTALNNSGFLGLGRTVLQSYSLISDSAWGEVVPIVVNDTSVLFPVDATLIAGRDEGDFYEAMGVVGVGPMVITTQSTLDGMYHQGYGAKSVPAALQPAGAYDLHPNIGFRVVPGLDPARSSDNVSLDAIGAALLDNYSAGICFLIIRISKASGLGFTTLSDHQMQAVVGLGWLGMKWTAPGSPVLNSGYVNGYALPWNPPGFPYGGQSMTNPVWLAANLFLYCQHMFALDPATQEEVLDIDAAVSSAAICDLTVPRVVESGSETQWKALGIINDQRPLRDWLSDVLLNCLGYYTFAFGRLRIGVRENASAAVAYTDGNMIFRSLQVSPLGPRFTKLVANFADREYGFMSNSAKYQDDDYAAELGGGTHPYHIQATINLSLTADISPATRLVITRGREEVGGVNETERKAARRVTWKTTILGLDTEPGMVASLTDPEIPGGSGHFRVESWKLNDDWTIDITARSVTTSMYDLTLGPKPADVVPSPIPGELLSVPLNPVWMPNKEIPITSDAIYSPTELSFSARLDYKDLADGKQLVLTVGGEQPVNKLAVVGPNLGGATQFSTGGTLDAGHIYYIAVCAAKSGVPTAISNIVPISIAGGIGSTNTNTITLSDITWPTGTFDSWFVFAGIDDPSLMCEQTSYGSAPSTITLSNIGSKRSFNPPNSAVASLVIKVKQLGDPGVLGETVTGLATNTLTCSDLAGHTDDYYDGGGRTLSIISRSNATIPIADFSITAYNTTTGTFTLSPDPVVAGVQVGDVFVVNHKGTWTVIAGNSRVTDHLAVNAIFPSGDNGGVGDILRIIGGKGRGQSKVITGIDTSGHTYYDLAGDWDANDYPDATSRYIREPATWTFIAPSVAINADTFGTSSQFQVALPNLGGLVSGPLLVAVVVVGSNGIESKESDSPMRLICSNAAVASGPGSLPAAPNVTVTGLIFSYNSNNEDVITINYNAPSPLGSFAGVHPWAEIPDQSFGVHGDPWTPVDCVNFVGPAIASQPVVPNAFFPYTGVAGGPGSVTIALPAGSLTISVICRFYLNSYNTAGVENTLVQANDTGPTPNRVQTLAAPGLPAGAEFAQLITGLTGVTNSYGIPGIEFLDINGVPSWRYNVSWTNPTDQDPWMTNPFGGVQFYSAYHGMPNVPPWYVDGVPVLSDFALAPASQFISQWYPLANQHYDIKLYVASLDKNLETNSLQTSGTYTTPVIHFVFDWPLSGTSTSSQFAPLPTGFSVAVTDDVDGTGNKAKKVVATWTNPADTATQTYGGSELVLQVNGGTGTVVASFTAQETITLYLPPPANNQTWNFSLISQDPAGNQNTTAASPVSGTPSVSLTVNPPALGITGQEYTSHVTSPSVSQTLFTSASGVKTRTVTATFTTPATATFGGCELRIYNSTTHSSATLVAKLSIPSPGSGVAWFGIIPSLPDPQSATTWYWEIVSYNVSGVSNTEANSATPPTPNGTLSVGAGGGLNGAFIANQTVGAAAIVLASITNAQIANATISGAQIALATITDANIATLSASKITAGTITAGVSIAVSGSGLTTKITQAFDSIFGYNSGVTVQNTANVARLALGAEGLSLVTSASHLAATLINSSGAGFFALWNASNITTISLSAAGPVITVAYPGGNGRSDLGFDGSNNGQVRLVTAANVTRYAAWSLSNGVVCAGGSGLFSSGVATFVTGLTTITGFSATCSSNEYPYAPTISGGTVTLRSSNSGSFGAFAWTATGT